MQNHIHEAFKDIALICDSNEFQSEKVLGVVQATHRGNVFRR